MRTRGSIRWSHCRQKSVRCWFLAVVEGQLQGESINGIHIRNTGLINEAPRIRGN
ncbi:hypothetical protein LNP05_29810 [Klebsiella pneumoniae subsp. pneumoniae]|nr:hypothetical protein [Klebsiella pneumoniae subsp. pneumoniae]